MKNRIWILLVLSVLFLNHEICSVAQVPAKPGNSSATVFFTAIDDNKKSVATLTKEDLRLLEDNVAQEILSLERQVDVPVSVAFLIDISLSQERVLPATRTMALNLANSGLRSGKDSAAVVTFTSDMSILQPLTADLLEVQSSISGVKFVPPPGNLVRGAPKSSQGQSSYASSIWDAIWFTCDEVLVGPALHSRRVIILFSDGADTLSSKKIDEAIERAAKDGVTIYAVGINDLAYRGPDKGTLEKLAERTGGRAFFPKKEKELEATLVEIEQELSAQYVLKYSPTSKKLDGSFRKVQIEVVNPEKKRDKLRLAYRPGYFAQ